MQSGSDSKPVLIIEDQPLIAFAMQRLVRRIDSAIAMTTCGCVESALQALRECSLWHRIFLAPDMAGAEGMSLARRLSDLDLADRCVLVAQVPNPRWVHEAQPVGRGVEIVDGVVLSLVLDGDHLAVVALDVETGAERFLESRSPVARPVTRPENISSGSAS